MVQKRFFIQGNFFGFRKTAFYDKNSVSFSQRKSALSPVFMRVLGFLSKKFNIKLVKKKKKKIKKNLYPNFFEKI